MKGKLSEFKHKIQESDNLTFNTLRRISAGNLTFTLIGFTLGVLIISSLSYAGFGFHQDTNIVMENKVSREVAGEKAVNMLNTRVLHNTPNNITSELLDVKDASYKSLPNFYEVTLEVRNPTAVQQTKIYVRKDASLIFLNHPRYIEKDLYRGQQHQ